MYEFEYAQMKKDSADGTVVWHYTGYDAFVGMVKEGKLRASDIRYLNDTSELNHYLHVAAEVANELGPPLKSVGQYLRNNTIARLQQTYITCFSKEFDDLSQWRAYCKTALAFSIGFDAEKLKKLFGLTDVIYRVDKQKEAIRAILKPLYDQAQKDPEFAVDPWPDGMRISFGSQYLVPACNQLKWTAYYNKSPAFVAENEVRIVWSGTAGGLKFQPSGSLVVPYIELDLRAAGQDGFPIKHVLVGPGPHKDELVEVAKLIAGNVPVAPSNVPFRNW
jgi:hypothetical protein